jgi:hypothetical protein
VLRQDALSIGKYVLKDVSEVLATSVLKVDCRNQRWPQRGFRHLVVEKNRIIINLIMNCV